jgi:hypothetical protein
LDLGLRSRLISYAFLLIVSAPLGALAQQSAPRIENDSSVSYGFVSPNKEENLHLEEAIKKVHSSEQTELVMQTNRVGCLARFRALVMPAIGSWSDGAEHSIVFKTRTGLARIRYAVASLGKYARQKTVLYFKQSRTGPGGLYILYPRRNRKDIAELSRAFDRAGIAHRTLVPLRRQTLIYVVDPKNELSEEVVTAARVLHARIRRLNGVAMFVGDETSRENAQTIFEEEIRAFETAHDISRRRCASLN